MKPRYVQLDETLSYWLDLYLSHNHLSFKSWVQQHIRMAAASAPYMESICPEAHAKVLQTNTPPVIIVAEDLATRTLKEEDEWILQQQANQLNRMHPADRANWIRKHPEYLEASKMLQGG